MVIIPFIKQRNKEAGINQNSPYANHQSPSSSCSAASPNPFQGGTFRLPIKYRPLILLFLSLIFKKIDNRRNSQNALVRRYFKTRGEFTTTEQNLLPDGSPNTVIHNRTGYYPIARTGQDFRECLCAKTKNSFNSLINTFAGSSDRNRLRCSSFRDPC